MDTIQHSVLLVPALCHITGISNKVEDLQQAALFVGSPCCPLSIFSMALAVNRWRPRASSTSKSRAELDGGSSSISVTPKSSKTGVPAALVKVCIVAAVGVGLGLLAASARNPKSLQRFLRTLWEGEAQGDRVCMSYIEVSAHTVAGFLRWLVYFILLPLCVHTHTGAYPHTFHLRNVYLPGEG